MMRSKSGEPEVKTFVRTGPCLDRKSDKKYRRKFFFFFFFIKKWNDSCLIWFLDTIQISNPEKFRHYKQKEILYMEMLNVSFFFKFFVSAVVLVSRFLGKVFLTSLIGECFSHQTPRLNYSMRCLFETWKFTANEKEGDWASSKWLTHHLYTQKNNRGIEKSSYLIIIYLLLYLSTTMTNINVQQIKLSYME
jgi:hypothetical protein